MIKVVPTFASLEKPQLASLIARMQTIDSNSTVEERINLLLSAATILQPPPNSDQKFDQNKQDFFINIANALQLKAPNPPESAKQSSNIVEINHLTKEAEKADRNDLAYGMITKALKNLAKELNCVVLLLTQLNRGLENRPDKRPMPSDSRDTGQIEQDVDLWLGLYKESVYDEEVSDQGLTEVLVRLNRHGGTGTAFVEMRQGFHVPLSIQDGARIINNRKQTKLDEQQASNERVNYKRK